MSAHPSVFIADEMTARGWTSQEVARRMGRASAREHAIRHLAIEMYLAIGEEESPSPNCRIGREMADDLARAFGLSADLFLNLERLWLESVGVTP